MAIIDDFKALNARVKEISRHILAPEGEDKLGEECNRLSRKMPAPVDPGHTHTSVMGGVGAAPTPNPPMPQGRQAKLICPTCRDLGWIVIPSPANGDPPIYIECKMCGNPHHRTRP